MNSKGRRLLRRMLKKNEVVTRQIEQPESAKHKEDQGKEERPKTSTKSILIKIAKVLTIFLTILATSLGVVTGYLALVPKVTVTQTESLVPVDPFSAQFIISNDGP